ncbi:MAG: YeeE/YedE thiosulfate transporter family protein [bacterium]
MEVLPLVGGALIGLSASILLLWTGRIAGISGIVAGVLRPQVGEVAWRVVFLSGLLCGGLLLAAFYPAALVVQSPGSVGMVALAGILVGYGTRLGSGCTSGHGVCGISRLSPRSLIATMTFIAAGAVTVYFAHPGIGGAP